MKYTLPILILIGTTGVQAQDLVPLLAACAKDKSPTSRLICFDSLAAKHAAPMTSSSSVAGSKWQVVTETSKIDDSKTVILDLQADTKISGWPGKTKTPALVIRCKERKTDAYIVTGMSPMVEYGTDDVTITLRIDKAPAFKLKASKSTDREALFIPSAVANLKRLMGGSTLLFEFVPFNSSPQMTTFQIAGLAEAIKPVREACKW